jgi:hypothetical protein
MFTWVCVFITAVPITKLFARGGGGMEDMCYERLRAKAGGERCFNPRAVVISLIHDDSLCDQGVCSGQAACRSTSIVQTPGEVVPPGLPRPAAACSLRAAAGDC